MSNLNVERVLSVHHWNDTLFSFKTTRDPALRFHNGHFVMLGLKVDGKPLMRAYETQRTVQNSNGIGLFSTISNAFYALLGL